MLLFLKSNLSVKFGHSSLALLLPFLSDLLQSLNLLSQLLFSQQVIRVSWLLLLSSWTTAFQSEKGVDLAMTLLQVIDVLMFFLKLLLEILALLLQLSGIGLDLAHLQVKIGELLLKFLLLVEILHCSLLVDSYLLDLLIRVL